MSLDPLEDPCLRIPNLRILCKIHVSRASSPHPHLRARYIIHLSGRVFQRPYLWIHYRMNQNPHGPTAIAIRHAGTPQRVGFANTKPAPCQNETQKRSKKRISNHTWTLASRYENAREQSSNHLDVSLPIRNSKRNFLRTRFAQVKRKFRPPETHFLWPCAEKTLRPRSAHGREPQSNQPLTPNCRKNPSVWPHCLGKNTRLDLAIARVALELLTHKHK